MTCGQSVGLDRVQSGDLGHSQLRVAVERRDRLLERDAVSGADTPGSSRVIDDQADYFHTGSTWLNPQQRKALAKYQQNVHQRRHTRGPAPTALSVDLQQGVVQVHASQEEVFVDRKDVDALLQSLRIADEETCRKSNGETSTSGSNRIRPSYVAGPDSTKTTPDTNPIVHQGAMVINRVQDGELSRMSDLGVCLSVRQPWASLLVTGRQRYEGRTWYTGHRGRLWIAAAQYTPSDEELAPWAGSGLTFPLGCLLGCVTVEDCLPQEEFRLRPDRYHQQEDLPVQLECDAPYVLVCSEPHQLTVKFPVRGGHKLFRLDQQIHRAAQKMLAL